MHASVFLGSNKKKNLFYAKNDSLKLKQLYHIVNINKIVYTFPNKLFFLFIKQEYLKRSVIKVIGVHL